MVMVHEVVPACSGHRLELVVWKGISEVFPRGGQCIEELIVRIVHLIDPEHLLEAAFVEAAVMGHEREAFNEGGYLFPHLREDWDILCVLGAESVNLLTEPLVVLRLRVDERVEGINDLSVAHDHHADAAYTGAALVGRLEILCWGDSYVGWPL